MNQKKLDYINRMRRLASAFIAASDTFNAMMSEQTYAGYTFAAEDFAGANGDVTPEQFNLFISTMQSLLAPLTVEQKQAIYAVKASSQNITPPPVTTI